LYHSSTLRRATVRCRFTAQLFAAASPRSRRAGFPVRLLSAALRGLQSSDLKTEKELRPAAAVCSSFCQFLSIGRHLFMPFCSFAKRLARLHFSGSLSRCFIFQEAPYVASFFLKTPQAARSYHLSPSSDVH